MTSTLEIYRTATLLDLDGSVGRARVSVPSPLAEAVVDHAAIAANVRSLRTAAGTDLMAVVKADAFGHGAVPVARTCVASGATWLGVTRVTEALELRRAGLTVPVLAWLYDPARAGEAVAAGVDLSVTGAEDLGAVVAGAPTGHRPRVHLELDTGMNRSGCPGEEWARLVAATADLERRGRIEVVGVWSHLSHGAEPDAVATHRQLLMFRVGLELARSAGLRPQVVHLANTAAVQHNPVATAHGLARVGAGIFGIGDGLRPAMTLRSRVVAVRPVAAGRGVGYDHLTTTPRDTFAGLVPLGFADGIPRLATGRARVWAGGRRAPLLGRVSMDQVVIDLGPDPVAAGAEVVVFGPGDGGEPTASDWARWCETNEHEIYTGIGARVARRHLEAQSRRHTNHAQGAPR